MSQLAPLGFKIGVKRGGRKGTTGPPLVGAGLEGQICGAQHQETKQARRGQAKTKALGEAGEGDESNLKTVERDSPFCKSQFAARIVHRTVTVGSTPAPGQATGQTGHEPSTWGETSLPEGASLPVLSITLAQTDPLRILCHLFPSKLCRLAG